MSLDIRPIDRERFLQKTRREPSGCLIWTASVNSKGYGTAAVRARIYLAHRVAWEMRYGAIPDGFTIDHVVCATPRCVEVTHLEVVTHRVNSWRQAGFKWSECYQAALRNLAANLRSEYTRSEAGLIPGLSLSSVKRAIHGGELQERGSGYFDRRISRKELGRFIIARALEDAGLPVIGGYVAQAEALIAQQGNAA